MYKAKILTATIASGASINTTGICIQGADKVFFECPSASAGLNTAAVTVRAQVCQTVGGTYRPLYAHGIYSANSGVQVFETWSGLVAGGVFEVPAAGCNYIKIETAGTNSLATAASWLCKVIVNSNS